MKKMSIYEPAMCCDTGLCGVGVDPELLRISTVLNDLKKNGMGVDRFNLNSAQIAFVNDKTINDKTINAFINEKGVGVSSRDAGRPCGGHSTIKRCD